LKKAAVVSVETSGRTRLIPQRHVSEHLTLPNAPSLLKLEMSHRSRKWNTKHNSSPFRRFQHFHRIQSPKNEARSSSAAKRSEFRPPPLLPTAQLVLMRLDRLQFNVLPFRFLQPAALLYYNEILTASHLKALVSLKPCLPSTLCVYNACLEYITTKNRTLYTGEI